MQFKELPKTKLSGGEKLCLWLLLVSPLALLYYRFASWLNLQAKEIEALSLLAWLLAAIFAALVLPASEAAAGKVSAGKRTGNLAAAATLPALGFAFVGALEALNWGQSGPGSALLLLALLLLASNAYSWFFAAAVSQEIGRQTASRGLARHPALRVNTGERDQARYSAPIYPLLAALLLIAFFLFAFALFPTAPTSRPPTDSIWLTLLAIGFAFSLLGLLGSNRFQALQARARRQHITLLGGRRSTIKEQMAVFAVAALVLGFLTVLLPLDRLVKLGEKLHRLNPPENLLSYLSPQSGLPQSTPAASRGGGLPLLILLLSLLLLLLLGRKLKKTSAWKKLIARLCRLYLRFAAWLQKRLKATREIASASLYPQDSPPVASRRIDVFENEELMNRLSPAEIILATYDLLLYLVSRRGWQRKILPPFETLAKLSEEKCLGREDLTLWTWLYARAAYSPQAPTREELPRAREAWLRLKADLQAGKTGSGSSPASGEGR
jgi:hypothetical protein